MISALRSVTARETMTLHTHIHTHKHKPWEGAPLDLSHLIRSMWANWLCTVSSLTVLDLGIEPLEQTTKNKKMCLITRFIIKIWNRIWSHKLIKACVDISLAEMNISKTIIYVSLSIYLSHELWFFLIAVYI